MSEVDLRLPEDFDAAQERELEQVSVAYLDGRVNSIFRKIAAGREQGLPLRESTTAAFQEYVLKPGTSEELQQFGRMIFLARSAAENQKRIDHLNTKEQTLTEDETQQLTEARKADAAYSAMVFAVASAHADDLTREQLEGWLSRGSNNDENWARRMTNRVAVEVAAQGILREAGAISAQRSETEVYMQGLTLHVESSLYGDQDVVVRPLDERAPRPMAERNDQGRVVLTINPADLGNFSVTEGRPEYVAAARQALTRN